MDGTDLTEETLNGRHHHETTPDDRILLCFDQEAHGHATKCASIGDANDRRVCSLRYNQLKI